MCVCIYVCTHTSDIIPMIKMVKISITLKSFLMPSFTSFRLLLFIFFVPLLPPNPQAATGLISVTIN